MVGSERLSAVIPGHCEATKNVRIPKLECTESSAERNYQNEIFKQFSVWSTEATASTVRIKNICDS